MSLALREEHPLLSNRFRDPLTAALLAVATAAVFLLVGMPGTRAWVQRIDNRVLDAMLQHRITAFTDVARLFDVLGSAMVTLPLRLVVAGYLAFRRRWWHFATFVSAVVVSEALIDTLKNLYDRGRPAASFALVHTTGSSFPSGHAVATSVTAVAMVLALLPAGRHRYAWGAAAALFALVMAVSRAYLAAHWLSDAIAGTLLGTSVALWSALVVQWIRDARHPRDRSPPAVRSRPVARLG